MVAENTSIVTKLSLFDSDQPMPTLWRQRDLADFATYPLITECKFFIKTNKTFFKWDSCHLSIRGNFLIYSKGKEKTQNIIDYIDLDAQMHKLTTLALNQSSRYKYNFTISSHGHSATFFSKDKKQFNAFLLQIRRYCVMTEFTDNYQVLNVLGQGGYGKVYLVEDKITKLKYAGKVIQISPRKCPEKQKLMIMNEIKILKKLDHHNIIKLYEVYEKNNEVCLILEYVQGQRLFEYIVHSGRLSEPETAVLMKQLFLTLTYLESQGILHRDIKPENILITKSDNNSKIELKLIDFGLATNYSKTDAIKKCGTAGYTAPEIIAGDPYDFKADLYSSGVVLYICLTGRPVYFGSEYKELYEENRRGIVKYKDKHWSDISKDAKELVQKILVSNPSQRASVDRALCHKWFESILTADEVKQITEFSFKTGKLPVAEEEKIANIPVLPSQMLQNFSLTSKSNSMGSASFSFITSKVGVSSNNSHFMLHSFYKNRTKEEVDASSVNTLNSQPVRHSSFFRNTSTLNQKRSIFLNMKDKSESRDYQKYSSATIPREKGNLPGTSFKLSSFVRENTEGDGDDDGYDDGDFTSEDEDDRDEESPLGRKYGRLKDMSLCFEKLSQFANNNM